MKKVIDDYTGYVYTHSNSNTLVLRASKYDVDKPLMSAQEVRTMCLEFFGILRGDQYDIFNFDCLEMDAFIHKDYIEERGDRHL